METKRKTGIRVDYKVNAETMVNEIVWSDITGTASPVVLVVSSLAEEIRDKAMWHGLDQKVTDAGAMGTDHWDGEDKPKRAATVGERLARMRRVAETLAAGQWNSRAPSDPLAGKSAEQLATLIAEATKRLEAIGVKFS